MRTGFISLLTLLTDICARRTRRRSKRRSGNARLVCTREFFTCNVTGIDSSKTYQRARDGPTEVRIRDPSLKPSYAIETHGTPDPRDSYPSSARTATHFLRRFLRRVGPVSNPHVQDSGRLRFHLSCMYVQTSSKKWWRLPPLEISKRNNSRKHCQSTFQRTFRKI